MNSKQLTTIHNRSMIKNTQKCAMTTAYIIPIRL